MDLLRTKISAGAEKPFRLLHFSDTHLALADERDDERKIELARKRAPYFPGAEENLREAIRVAREEDALMVHTGDLIDFVSWKNLDAARIFSEENDCFFIAGNHEFSLYVGEAFEDTAYRNQSLAKVQASFKNDIRMNSRIINGVNLVALDNGYYLLDEEQLAFLKKECDRGLPVILMWHTPLYTPDFWEFQMKKGPCAYLMSAPQQCLDLYDAYRKRQQTPDAVTLEATEYIMHSPVIKAILAGHTHANYETMLTPEIPQYMVDTHTARIVEVC